MSDREFQLWKVYLDHLWNNPDRSDYYLMQIAQEIVISRTAKNWPLDAMKINFNKVEKEAETPVSELTEEELMERAREVSESRRAMLIAQNKKARNHD